MRSISAMGPDGAEWSVRVVWQPRWRGLATRFGDWRRKRKKKKKDDGSTVDTVNEVVDMATAPSSGELGDWVLIGFIVAAGAAIAAAVLWWLLLPLLLLVVDAVLIVILLLLAIPTRVLFRRPWTVEAVPAASADGAHEPKTRQVVGWRAALRARDELAEQLKAGHHPTVALSE